MRACWCVCTSVYECVCVFVCHKAVSNNISFIHCAFLHCTIVHIITNRAVLRLLFSLNGVFG